VTAVIERGIESGTFREVDARRTAAHILAAIQGARIRWVTLGDDDAIEAVHDSLVEDLVDGWLVVE
jgi:hypothetical protein